MHIRHYISFRFFDCLHARSIDLEGFQNIKMELQFELRLELDVERTIQFAKDQDTENHNPMLKCILLLVFRVNR